MELIFLSATHPALVYCVRWARHGWSCHGGKPFLVYPEDPLVHHVFFDDNIRLEDEDSIVLPLVRWLFFFIN